MIWVVLVIVVVEMYDYIIVGVGIVGFVVVNCLLVDLFVIVIVIDFGDD